MVDGHEVVHPRGLQLHAPHDDHRHVDEPLHHQGCRHPVDRRQEERFGDVRTDEAAVRYCPLHIMLTMTHSPRKGFTLNEVVISLVILSVIGAAFTRILTYQTRYL